MTVQSTKGEHVKRIRKTIAKLKDDMPSLIAILSTYGDVFIARAKMREELPFPLNVRASSPDSLRFSQGMTLMNEGIFPLSIDAFDKVRDRMIPALSKAFPKIRPILRKLKAALKRNTIDLKDCMEAMLHARDDSIVKAASDLGTDPLTLKLILGQLLKPVIEMQAKGLGAVIQNLNWKKGYCPVCGSLPVMSYLKENEGQRWLICGTCSHEWRFMRTLCPFCENQNPKNSEFCYVEERDFERAEMCHQCKRYLAGIDLRKYPYEFFPEVAVTSTMYLDILAQQRGFLPMADPTWTLVPCFGNVSGASRAKA